MERHSRFRVQDPMGQTRPRFFDTQAVTRCWLAHIGLDNIEMGRLHGPAARDQACGLLAQHTARHIDVNGILELIGKAGIP